MLIDIKEETSEWMEILSGLSQVMRCCCRDEAFCESVTFHQFMILDAVAGKKELHMAELHKILSVKKSTTTRLVNPLIKKGLLRRVKAEHDSRAIKLVLTSQGIDIHKKVLACLADFLQRMLGNIPAKKRSDVLESVKIFITAIKNPANGCNCC